MEHASDNWTMGVIIIIFALVIIVRILTAQRGNIPTIRRIPGLSAVDEAIGRATEMGRPVLFVPGIGSIGDGSTTVPTLQGLSILGYVAKAVARFGNRVIVVSPDPVTVGIAEEVLRDSYQQAGRPELFNVDDVRFLGGQQFAFASGVAGILSRERIAASFLFGSFYAESLVLAEVGQRVGAIQIAGTEQRTQIPFFIAACDYVIIGDEFYAASAYLSRNPTLLGSIVAQDYCKIAMLVAVAIGVFCATLLGHQSAGAFILNWWPHHPMTINYGGIPHWLASILTSIKKSLTA